MASLSFSHKRVLVPLRKSLLSVIADNLDSPSLCKINKSVNWGTSLKDVRFFGIFLDTYLLMSYTSIYLSTMSDFPFWEVSALNIRLNFDFFLQIFRHFFFFFNFPKIWANVEFILINLITFKAPHVQI